MKQNAPNAESRIADLSSDIMIESEHWKAMKYQGCNDPFWADGCNMNLIRNHIISDKESIREICEENGMILPAEYYIPTPPEVDNNYMANLKQKERVEMLRQRGKISTKKCPAYNSEQLSLF